MFTLLENVEPSLRFDIFSVLTFETTIESKRLATAMDGLLLRFQRWKSLIVPVGNHSFVWKVGGGGEQGFSFEISRQATKKELQGFQSISNIVERYDETSAYSFREMLMNEPRLDGSNRCGNGLLLLRNADFFWGHKASLEILLGRGRESHGGANTSRFGRRIISSTDAG